MLIISHTSLVTLVVRGVLDWNISPLISNKDIKYDLEVVALTSISARTFEDHIISWLQKSSTFSLHFTKYLLHLKKIIFTISDTSKPHIFLKTLLKTFDKLVAIFP
jgi:chromosome condensin MukBEF complex kleisin-like MukF subunit